MVFAIIKATGLTKVYMYKCLPLLSCKKLLATALIEANNMMIQNRAFHVNLSGMEIKDIRQTKTVETTYNNTPLRAYFDRHSKRISFLTSCLT